MARGTERQESYRGRAGATRSERIHYSAPNGEMLALVVHRSIDASSDPDLAARLLETDPARTLNRFEPPGGGDPIVVQVSVVYHDPDRRVFALVLPESARHVELRARAELMLEIAEDREVAVPRYVRELVVVYGPGELRRYLERRSDDEIDASMVIARQQALDARESALGRRESELGRAAEAIERRVREVEARAAEVEARAAEVEARAAEVEARAAEVRRRAAPVANVARSGDPDPDGEEITTNVQIAAFVDGDDEGTPRPADAEAITSPVVRVDPEALSAEKDLPAFAEGRQEPGAANGAGAGPGEDEVLEIEPEPLDEGEVIVADQLIEEGPRPAQRAARSPVVGSTRVGGKHDAALERWFVSREPTLRLLDERGQVRLAASSSDAQLDDLLSDRLQVRVQLHRLPTYPLITLALGTRAAMEGARDAGEPLVFQFDADRTDERALLETLAEDFTFTLELFDSEYLLVRKRTISAALGDNVTYALSAAEEHLESIPAPERNFNRAMLRWADPDHDRFARRHPERKEFRDDKLQAVDTPMQVRRALAVARRFSVQTNQEYLILQRGYPLRLWHQRRRRVVERALELGLWVGQTLAGVAIGEGLARSRDDLALELQRNFARMVGAEDHDLDEDAIRDNWEELKQELRALGLDSTSGVAPRSTPIDSGEEPVASGLIGPVTALVERADPDELEEGAVPDESAAATRGRTTLVGQLDDKDRRLEAALELCDRGEQAALPALFSALDRMTRGEAGRVLGNVLPFGEVVVPHLVRALSSRKGFVRQGAALALGVLKNERGIEEICDLLVREPTEIWKEVARAVGEVGSGAVMSLVSRLADAPPEKRERVAWALAHAANHGARKPVETLAGGRDPVAAGVARHALELANLAKSDDLAVRGARAPRDQTVNRAFSRRFFEAMRGGERVPNSVEPEADLSGPAMMLDESDLIETRDLEDHELDATKL